MLSAISIAMIFLYNLFFFIQNHAKDHHFGPSMARCIPMILGMTGSLTIGLIFGAWFPQNLALSTILSVVSCVVYAFFVGKGFGVNGMVEAQASSLMGSVMGAMLGAMISNAGLDMVVMFFDLVYLTSFYSIEILMRKELRDKLEKLKLKRTLIYMAFVLNILIIGALGLSKNEYSKKYNKGGSESMIHMSHMENNDSD